MPSVPDSRELDSHVAAYQGGNLYDFDNEILLTWYPKRILATCGVPGSLLELGLGHGFATNAFDEKFQRHTVVEGSPAVAANFRSRFPLCRADIREGYFEDFVCDERYDVIVMGFILEHVDNPVALLARFRQALAPNGRLYVAVPNAEALNRRLGHIAGLLSDLQELTAHDLLLGHKRYYTVRSLTADIRAAGLDIDSMEGIYLKPFMTQQMVALNLSEAIISALCVAGIGYPELSCGLLARVASTGP
jgi:SAM-dependent methyltransferase